VCRKIMRLGESNAMIRCQVTCVVDVRLVVVVCMCMDEEFVAGCRVRRGWSTCAE
jgi:hypothetical protein